MEIIFLRFVMGLFFLWLIGRAAVGFGGVLGRILASPPLVYIGKISYGIYVVHFFVPEMMSWLFSLAGLTYSFWLPFQFILNSTATLLLATMTWYAIESPFNGLKRFFNYYEGVSRRQFDESVRRPA